MSRDVRDAVKDDITDGRQAREKTHDKTHWLYRADKQRTLWWLGLALLLLAIIPEFFIQHYAHFKQQGIYIDASFGFYVWYSFLAAGAMIVLAKLLGIFLKRRDTYYDE